MPEVYTDRPRVRASVISFLRNILPKKLVAAIDVLLKPCCTLEAESIEFTCSTNDPGTVNVVIKYNNIPSFSNYAVLYSSVDGTFSPGVISGNTVTFEDLSLTAGNAAFVGTIYTVTTGNPLTSPNSIIAVMESATLGTYNVPSCP